MTLPAVCSKVTLVLVERVLLGGPVPLDLPGDGHERPVHLLGDFPDRLALVQGGFDVETINLVQLFKHKPDEILFGAGEIVVLPGDDIHIPGLVIYSDGVSLKLILHRQDIDGPFGYNG